MSHAETLRHLFARLRQHLGDALDISARQSLSREDGETARDELMMRHMLLPRRSNSTEGSAHVRHD